MRRFKSEHSTEIDDNQICNLVQQLDSVKNGFQFLFEEFYLQDGKSKHNKRISEDLQNLIAMLTAAHKELPFGTIVLVMNTSNYKSTIVEITDRGPYIDGRIIDLSKSAAQQIEMDGIAPVVITVLK